MTAHTDRVVEAADMILAEVAPPVAFERLAQIVGPLGMTGIVYERERREYGPDRWPVRFRHTPTTRLVPAPDDSHAHDLTHVEGEFTVWGDVESHLSDTSECTAAKKVSVAIGKLTYSHWL